MRADLDHLPHRQQHELERIRTTLLTEFEAAINSGGGGTQSWRRDGKVLRSSCSGRTRAPTGSMSPTTAIFRTSICW